MTWALNHRDSRANLALDEFVARRCAAGWKPKAIVAACDGAISLRTAYRWVKEVAAIEKVQVGEYVATFAIRRTLPPIRLTEWRRA